MWVPEKMVIQELSNTTLKILDRRYFEVCVLTESMCNGTHQVPTSLDG